MHRNLKRRRKRNRRGGWRKWRLSWACCRGCRVGTGGRERRGVAPVARWRGGAEADFFRASGSSLPHTPSQKRTARRSRDTRVTPPKTQYQSPVMSAPAPAPTPAPPPPPKPSHPTPEQKGANSFPPPDPASSRPSTEYTRARERFQKQAPYYRSSLSPPLPHPADTACSKQSSEYFDPCQAAAERSLKCLHRNQGDREFCADYFQ